MNAAVVLAAKRRRFHATRGADLGLLLVFVNVAPNARQINGSLVARRAIAVPLGAALALAIASLSHPSPFSYFRF